MTARARADDLASWLLEEAQRIGFHAAALTGVETPETYPQYTRWLDAGHAGEMGYLERSPQREMRADPRTLLPSARSVVVCADAYAPARDLNMPDLIAAYARGRDYHQIMHQKLRRLAAALERRVGHEIAWRGCVDTAPVLERDLAQRAGLGFIGKNTLLIRPGIGSYVLLAELLVDVELTTRSDPARPRPRCGGCRACLDRCPTRAFVDAYTLDARRCVAYLTIEHHGWIPRDLRPLIGAHIFGCDVCQAVCPFNTHPDRHATEAAYLPRARTPSLLHLAQLGTNQRKRWLHNTPLARLRRTQWRRNLAIALANTATTDATGVLVGWLDDRSPVVRGHAAWALGVLRSIVPWDDLLEREEDGLVRDEMVAAQAESSIPRRIDSGRGRA